MTFAIADITYCSNVHPGESLEDITANLSNLIAPVCRSRGLKQMATGLWLSAAAAEQLQQSQALAAFRSALSQAGLYLTTINGFPFGDFHGEHIKANVYLPDWADANRRVYTEQLAEVLAACLPERCDSGTISTVPLGYKRHWHEQKQQAAVTELKQLGEFLQALKRRTGKHILVCLEMEPDCVLESTDELIEFFERHVLPDEVLRQHLAVCFDVCHQAVMFEDVYEALERIAAAQIAIGKIQLSSALQAVFDHAEGLDETLIYVLQQFCEPKYLHQVKHLDGAGMLEGRTDLHYALAAGFDHEHEADGHWRIHFHLPIHTDNLIHPKLKNTSSELLRTFDFLKDNPTIRPTLEVETYSWQVLPQALRPHDDQGLIEGITAEVNWVEQALKQRELLA